VNQDQPTATKITLRTSTHSCPTETAPSSIRFNWLSHILTQAENWNQIYIRQGLCTRERILTKGDEGTEELRGGQWKLTKYGYKMYTTTTLTDLEVILVGPPQTIEE
jgi:hypothetical protein